MDKHWYMVAATSGREDSAVELLKQAIVKNNLQEQFGEILVPKQNETKLVRGKKQTVSTRIFPGYIFVEMVLSPRTQSLVQAIKFISHFIGTANRPTIVSPEEVAKIQKRVDQTLQSPTVNHGLAPEMTVKVLEGPFKDFTGKVDKVQGTKITVLVEVFGRPTPVELSASDVMKV